MGYFAPVRDHWAKYFLPWQLSLIKIEMEFFFWKEEEFNFKLFKCTLWTLYKRLSSEHKINMWLCPWRCYAVYCLLHFLKNGYEVCWTKQKDFEKCIIYRAQGNNGWQNLSLCAVLGKFSFSGVVLYCEIRGRGCLSSIWVHRSDIGLPQHDI